VRGSEESVLVTGGSGFIAAALIAALRTEWNVRSSQRRRGSGDLVVGALGHGADWRRALEGVATVIHLAGPSSASAPHDAIRRAIVSGTRELVEQATSAGVRRVIFVSSIKACAEESKGTPLREEDEPRPADVYGRAKLQAERIVLARAPLAPVVLRPPLVYAANAKGNFARFLRQLDTDLPLPFAGIENRRSLISLSSLVNAIVAVMRNESAPAGVFHLADEPAVSTTEMATLLRKGMGRPARLFHVPGFDKFGPPPLVRSLEVDSSRFCAAFDFAGSDTREGLVACGRAWREKH